MSFGAYLLSFIVFGALAAMICYEVYNGKDHSKCALPEFLREDAKISSVKQEKVGLKGSVTYRTTILFQDGFQYISHKCDRNDHFTYYTIFISEDTAENIRQSAYNAHRKAIEKRDHKAARKKQNSQKS